MPSTPNPRLVDLLVEAHETATSFSCRPELIPASLDAAMSVQGATITALNGRVGGWKVGFNAQGQSMAGPMLANCIQASGSRWTIGTAGPILAEVEIAVRLKYDLPPRPAKPYGRADIAAAVSHVMAGIELIRSRLREGPAAPFPIWLADRLGNAGYILGEEVSGLADRDLSALRCQLRVDGTLMHDKIGGHPQNDPLAPVVAYANGQNDVLGGLRAGQIVTTGSLIVPLSCRNPVELEAEIDGLGQVRVTMD